MNSNSIYSVSQLTKGETHPPKK